MRCADFADPHGQALATLLARPVELWQAPLHTAAALGWKAYASWLCQPLASAAVDGTRLPVLDPDVTGLRLSEGEGPYVEVDWSEAEHTHDLAVAVGALRAHFDQVIAALETRTGVGRRGLWGTVAESLALPFTALESSDATTREATAVVLLEQMGVADLVDLCVVDGRLEMTRRTCCLAFTAPGLNGALCSTCCIPDSAATALRRVPAPAQTDR